MFAAGIDSLGGACCSFLPFLFKGGLSGAWEVTAQLKSHILFCSEKLSYLCKSWFTCRACLQQPFRAARYGLGSQYSSENKVRAWNDWCFTGQLHSVLA